MEGARLCLVAKLIGRTCSWVRGECREMKDSKMILCCFALNNWGMGVALSDRD